MKYRRLLNFSHHLTVAIGSLALISCSGQDRSETETDNGAGTGEPTNPAVVVTAQIVTPTDYLTFVRAFPDVPEGDVDFSGFREFGNANTYLNEGKLFVEQDGVVQRFDVNEDLELVEGPRFSWADFGIATAEASYTVFVSGTRAYTFAPQLGVVVVWDPDAMVRTGVIDIDFPERPVGSQTWASSGHVVDGNVVWNVFSGSFETLVPHTAVTLTIANANSDEPLTVLEDARCLPGGPAFVDEQGDYYVHGGGFFGYFYAYGGVPDARTCVLRMNAGETRFDPDYELDYKEVTGSYVNTPWIQVTEDQYVTRAWDPAIPVPESPDDFWAGEGLRPLLVDLSERTAEPYPDLEGVIDVDGETRIVDGVSYFQITETGYGEGGEAEIVELHPNGIRPKFRMLGGFLLGLERLR